MGAEKLSRAFTLTSLWVNPPCHIVHSVAGALAVSGCGRPYSSFQINLMNKIPKLIATAANLQTMKKMAVAEYRKKMGPLIPGVVSGEPAEVVIPGNWWKVKLRR